MDERTQQHPDHPHPHGPRHAEHGHEHDHAPVTAAPAEYWDDRYRSRDRIWSGRPNPALVRVVGGLPVGRALELGCGEGADAVWLAAQGWQVVAVDVSQVALDRAAGHAADEGVADRIEWQRHDLGVSFPEGSYDLVTSQFLHSQAELPRERILRRAAEAVAPGGLLLIAGHAGFPEGVDGPPVHLPSTAEVRAQLRLSEAEWKVLLEEDYLHEVTDHDGHTFTRTDNVLAVRRIG
ncbi:class I SAM-dependent methyltransferase [Streptacidiphilus monticola]|uniref:Class I SAM-dependent methyltransferase n=1 Tax=Streptacidiphilus monticola TaxID=2161674 RepID=A0ABW1FZR9_9ACTN